MHQDWPSNTTFAKAFPEQDKAFKMALPEPCATMASVDGLFNIASHGSINDLVPDLGESVTVRSRFWLLADSLGVVMRTKIVCGLWNSGVKPWNHEVA